MRWQSKKKLLFNCQVHSSVEARSILVTTLDFFSTLYLFSVPFSKRRSSSKGTLGIARTSYLHGGVVFRFSSHDLFISYPCGGLFNYWINSSFEARSILVTTLDFFSTLYLFSVPLSERRSSSRETLGIARTIHWHCGVIFRLSRNMKMFHAHVESQHLTSFQLFTFFLFPSLKDVQVVGIA